MNLIAPIGYSMALIVIVVLYVIIIRNIKKDYEKRLKENSEAYSKLINHCCDMCEKNNESLMKLTVEEITNSHNKFTKVLQTLEKNISDKINSNEFQNQ